MFEQSELAKQLFAADNDLDRFDILAGAALLSDKFPDEFKTEEHRLAACDTKTWFYLDFDGGIRLYAESDSLFVKGLCIVLADIVSKTSKEGLAHGIGFADECYARGIIDGSRRKGLLSLEDEIINFSNKYYGENK